MPGGRLCGYWSGNMSAGWRWRITSNTLAGRVGRRKAHTAGCPAHKYSPQADTRESASACTTAGLDRRSALLSGGGGSGAACSVAPAALPPAVMRRCRFRCWRRAGEDVSAGAIKGRFTVKGVGHASERASPSASAAVESCVVEGCVNSPRRMTNRLASFSRCDHCGGGFSSVQTPLASKEAGVSSRAVSFCRVL